MEWLLWIDLWIHDRDAIRQIRFWFVVIEHNNIDAALSEIGDLNRGRRAAIDCDQMLWMVPPNTEIYTSRSTPITVCGHSQGTTIGWGTGT